MTSTLRFARPPKRTLGLFELYGSIGFFLLLVARFVPLSRLPTWGCALRKLTGYPCLSCGMTRSFTWFASGQFLDSLIINPLGFLLALTSALGALYVVLSPLRPPRLQVELSERASDRARVAAIVAIVVNWGYLIVRTALGQMT